MGYRHNFFRLKYMKRFRGFTLVELLIVTAFIGIMTGIVFVSMSGRRTNGELKSAAREVAAAIRMAQSSALSGSKKGIPESRRNRGLCWVNFRKESNTSYGISVHYKDATGNACSGGGGEGDGTAEIFSLRNGVAFSSSNWNSSGAGNTLRFDLPRGDVNSASRIGLTKNGMSFFVCVSASGVVTEGASCS